MRSRFVIAVAILLVAAGALMASGAKDGGGAATSGAQKPVVNITGWLRSDTGVVADNYAVQHISQMTDTQVVFNALQNEEYETKLNLLLASGERPDIIAYGTDEMEYSLVKSGLLLPINEYFSKYPEISLSRPQATWDAMKHQDGNIYAVPVQQMVLEFAILYRGDWLDKLGLAVPRNLDEYFRVADAVTNRDPDGNGQTDTYAFGGRGRIKRYFDHIFAAYGVIPIYFRPDSTGKLVEGAVTPQAKEALRYIRRLYENRVIDPEFVTDNSDRLRQKTYAGRFGAAYDYFYVTDSSNIYGHYNQWKAQNPNGRWVTSHMLEGPAKNIGLRSESRRGWMKTSILREGKNLDGALRVVNWMSSEAGRMFLNYGLEGTHYTMSGGVVKPLLSAEEQTKLGINEVYVLMDELYKHTSPEFQATLSRANTVASPDVTDGWTANVPEINQYSGDLSDLIEVTFLKMIVGEVPIDGGFESFVQEFMASGGRELTEALNAEYARRAGR